eukprot:TRINITY_DN4667_c0_g1_i1.p1 TRINITY_DN4667_c0_g1~~TRINITY_DN4667_c0_g1_i1.p1  ORF type:complete len:278 (-),score=63.89 TRINITY_DN4667_c0_g1_i1:1280-2113(-)
MGSAASKLKATLNAAKDFVVKFAEGTADNAKAIDEWNASIEAVKSDVRRLCDAGTHWPDDCLPIIQQARALMTDVLTELAETQSRLEQMVDYLRRVDKDPKTLPRCMEMISRHNEKLVRACERAKEKQERAIQQFEKWKAAAHRDPGILGRLFGCLKAAGLMLGGVVCNLLNMSVSDDLKRAAREHWRAVVKGTTVDALRVGDVLKHIVAKQVDVAIVVGRANAIDAAQLEEYLYKNNAVSSEISASARMSSNACQKLLESVTKLLGSISILARIHS